jgi:hypothetical protein
LCSGPNQTPRRGGWQPVQTGDGRRTWTHTRTGLTITTVPATWRPAGWRPPCHHHRCHHPPGHHHGSGSGPGSGPGTGPGAGRRARAPDDRDDGRPVDRMSIEELSRYIDEHLAHIHGTPPRPPKPPPPDPDDCPF